ncbi:hypothetical protein UlMin_025549 [Ulmus minor]
MLSYHVGSIGELFVSKISFSSHKCSAARETLEQVMADALWKSGSNRSAVRAVCLAVFGINHPIDQQRILDWLSDIFPSHVRLYVKNDVVIALASGTMGKLHGCVLITATWTIAYGFSEDGGKARAFGAGPVLGDWGSGYGIAAHALIAIIKAHDGHGAQTMLVSSILESIGLSSPDELIRWTYADPSWAHIVALHKHLTLSFLWRLSMSNKIWNLFSQQKDSLGFGELEWLGDNSNLSPLSCKFVCYTNTKKTDKIKSKYWWLDFSVTRKYYTSNLN